MDIAFDIDKRGKAPIYLQIKEQLRRHIVGAKLPEGTALPDLKTLAALAGVSSRTADLGVQELIKDGVCYRRPKKGTYVANPAATARKRVICLALPDGTLEQALSARSSHGADIDIYRGVASAANAAGLDLITVSGDLEPSLRFYRQSKELLLQGAVLGSNCPPALATALAKEFPTLRLVYANYYFHGFADTPANVHGVFNDDFGGAYQLASALWKKGGRKFGLCTVMSDDENYRERVKGYVAALRSQGVADSDIMVETFPDRKGLPHLEYGHRFVDAFLSRAGGTPDTLLCVHDLIARGAIDELRRRGLDAKITVAGYDGMLPQARAGAPFPTMAIDFEEIGREAVRVASGVGESFPKTIRTMPRLVLGDEPHGGNA